MYKIMADSILIYDSTIDDYRIGKGEINLEIEKAGSFVFSLFADSPYYNSIVQMKTIIKVYRDSELIFRGRALKVEDGFYNTHVITCEGELNFLLDSVIRPWSFEGRPIDLFTQIIEDHNSQVDAEKQFRVGVVTVFDNNDYINRSSVEYEDALSCLKSHMLGSELGGYLYITHDADDMPVLNYIADFPNTTSQSIVFGENLKDYVKTTNSGDIMTVIVPLGARLLDPEGNETNEYLTIESVNGGKDYIEDANAIALRGRITKVVQWENVTTAIRLKNKAISYLAEAIKQNITIDLTAIDLHLLDRSIESFHCGEYIPILSIPHNLNTVMLCKKQTINLLRPDNDSLSLGYSYSTFTETSAASNKAANNVNSRISSVVVAVTNTVTDISNLQNDVNTVTETLSVTNQDLEAVVRVVQQNAVNIQTNAQAIQTLNDDVDGLADETTRIAGQIDESARKASDAQTAAANAERLAASASETANSMDDRITALEDLGLFIGDDGNIYQRED